MISPSTAISPRTGVPSARFSQTVERIFPSFTPVWSTVRRRQGTPFHSSWFSSSSHPSRRALISRGRQAAGLISSSPRVPALRLASSYSSRQSVSLSTARTPAIASGASTSTVLSPPGTYSQRSSASQARPS